MNCGHCNQHLCEGDVVEEIDNLTMHRHCAREAATHNADGNRAQIQRLNETLMASNQVRADLLQTIKALRREKRSILRISYGLARACQTTLAGRKLAEKLQRQLKEFSA